MQMRRAMSILVRGYSEEFKVEVNVHQDSTVLSPLLFIVLEA